MFLIAITSICLAANLVVSEEDSLDRLEKEIQVVYEEEIVLDEDLDAIDVQEIVFDEVDSESEDAENQ